MSDVFIRDEKGNVYAFYIKDGRDAVVYVHPGSTVTIYEDACARRQPGGVRHEPCRLISSPPLRTCSLVKKGEVAF